MCSQYEELSQNICFHVCWYRSSAACLRWSVRRAPLPARREPAALLEGCSVADGRDRGRGDYGSDSGDRDQAPAWFKFAGDACDQLVAFLDLSMQVRHL